ncbi:MAG: hypothetical protein O7J95_19910 [Planctomycetota bacterium]|nr:hypothetical protein [Planctomycetota bacterium]
MKRSTTSRGLLLRVLGGSCVVGALIMGCTAREPVSPDENAFLPWSQAFREVVGLLDYVESVGGEEEALALEETLHGVLEDGEPFPEGAARERLESWVQDNRKALLLFDAGSLRPRWAVPEVGAAELDFEPSGLAFFDLMTLKRLRARLHAERGALDDATRSIEDLLRAGELVAGGEGLLVHHLALGRNCQLAVLRDVRWLASRTEVPAISLARVLLRLARVSSVRAQLRRALDVELHRFILPSVEAMPTDGDTSELAHTLLGDERDSIGVETLAAILEGHPAPFDRRDTEHLVSAHLAAIQGRLDEPWNAAAVQGLDGENRVFLEKWPPALSPSLARLFVTEEDADGESSDPEVIARACDALRGTANPAGRYVVASLFWWSGGGAGLVEAAFLADAERRATTALVALRLYLGRKGRLPDALDELVAEGILERLPRDPFGSGPLGYSRERRLMWSVGPDGGEDGEGGLLDAEGLPRPTVWPAPGFPEERRDG